jgi:hypothetical protein
MPSNFINLHRANFAPIGNLCDGRRQSARFSGTIACWRRSVHDPPLGRVSADAEAAYYDRVCHRKSGLSQMIAVLLRPSAKAKFGGWRSGLWIYDSTGMDLTLV